MPDSEPGFVWPVHVVQDRRGSYYVADPMAGIPIAVFDSLGKYSGLVGKLGQGPGDVSLANALVVGPDDTLTVFARLMSVFGPDRRFVRARAAIPNGRVNIALLLPDGRYLTQAILPTSDLVGEPFHILSRTGQLQTSFGARARDVYLESDLVRQEEIALAGASEFWAMRANEYILQRWSLDGTLVAAIGLNAPWFKSWRSWDGRLDVGVPPTRVVSITQDGQGLLWILSVIPDALPTKRNGSTRGEGRLLTPTDVENLEDSMIEVIDPRKGTLVFSQRFSAVFDHFSGRTRLVQVLQSQRGEVSVAVWQPTLRTTGGRRYER
jgi:hypothetical protein